MNSKKLNALILEKTAIVKKFKKDESREKTEKKIISETSYDKAKEKASIFSNKIRKEVSETDIFKITITEEREYTQSSPQPTSKKYTNCQNVSVQRTVILQNNTIKPISTFTISESSLIEEIFDELIAIIKEDLLQI